MADHHTPAEMRFGKIDDIKSRIAAAVDASRRFLFGMQDREEGFWCGELGAEKAGAQDPDWHLGTDAGHELKRRAGPDFFVVG